MKKIEIKMTYQALPGASFFWPRIEVGNIDPLRQGIVQ
jgi:hypothetical protein